MKPETQCRFELDLFLDFLVEKNVRVYCELGLYAGTTFLEVYKTLREHYGPDVRFAMIAIEYPTNNEAFNHLESIVLPEIRKDKNVDLYVFISNSTSIDIVENVNEAVLNTEWKNENSVIFIDGDHSYRQSRDDYLAYRDMFTFVAFNDISPRTVQKNTAKHGRDIATVYHLWDGLTIPRSIDEYIVFDDTTSVNPRGIGILL